MIKIYVYFLCICILSLSCNLLNDEDDEDEKFHSSLTLSKIGLQSLTENSIKIEWYTLTDSEEKVNYTVERKELGSVYETLASNLIEPSFVDINLDTTKDYTYLVYAIISDNIDSSKVNIHFGKSNRIIFLYNSTSRITKISFSQDGKYLAGSGEEFLYIWNTSDWDLEKEISLNGSYISDHVFFDGGNKIVYSWDSTISVLSLTDWSNKNNIMMKSGSIGYLAVTPDQRKIIISSLLGNFEPGGGGYIKEYIDVYDLESWSYFSGIDSLKYVYGLVANPDNETFSIFSYHSMRVYLVDSGSLINEVDTESEFFWSPKFNHDSTQLVVLTSRYGWKYIKIYDTNNWSLIKSMYSNSSVYDIDFVPNAYRLIFSETNFVKILDIETEQVILSLSNGSRGMESICYSPLGNKFAAINYNDQLRVWSNELSKQWYIVE